ncbi:MAG: tRNA 2-thiocytidine biosynthesis protein TtcA [Clostridia bacterium]|nr:tRNA 2-thiocytidine biosynthesis protein TtcA [Clostridia bacterium]
MAQGSVKEILSRARAAIDKYDMIPEGGSVAVGVSGGKDSLVTLYALARLREFHPRGFSVTALTADPCFGGGETDFSAVEELCRSLDVPYIIRRTKLYDIVFEDRREKNPCSLCAKMRRGILHTMAVDAGCGTVALGHHSDDAAETVMMNLLCGGRFAGLPPKSWLDRRQISVIRPMIFCDEALMTRAARDLALPVVPSGCPVDGNTERHRVREVIESLERQYPDLRAKLANAAQADFGKAK